MALFEQQVQLAAYSNFKIGGPADYFFRATTEEDLRLVLQEAGSHHYPVSVLGAGCNVLVSDAGIRGAVIVVGVQGITVEKFGEDAGAESVLVRVGAGVLVSDFLNFCIAEGLSGWEWAGGLPGTMGGALWGNAGAYGGETKDRVREVVSITPQGKRIVRTGSECSFDYRSSVFKTQARDEIIVSALFALGRGEPSVIQKAIDEKKVHRITRHPLEYPNCGSVFKNTPVAKVPAATLERFAPKVKNDPFPVLPTAVLTAAAGLAGYRVGGALLSPKHTNFIVNTGGATAADVKAVMVHVQSEVQRQFGVALEPEVIFIGS
jgi:UDP-N-acetylmuramate dehydrogenase